MIKHNVVHGAQRVECSILLRKVDSERETLGYIWEIHLWVSILTCSEHDIVHDYLGRNRTLPPVFPSRKKRSHSPSSPNILQLSSSLHLAKPCMSRTISPTTMPRRLKCHLPCFVHKNLPNMMHTKPPRDAITVPSPCLRPRLPCNSQRSKAEASCIVVRDFLDWSDNVA